MQVPAPPPGQLMPAAVAGVPPALQGSSELFANMAFAGVGAYALLIVLAFLSFKVMRRPAGGGVEPVVAVVKPAEQDRPPAVANPIVPNPTTVRIPPPMAPPPAITPTQNPPEVKPTPNPTEIAKTDTAPATRTPAVNPFDNATTPASESPSRAPTRPEFGSAQGGPLSVPITNIEDVTLGPVGCPAIVIGKQVWNIAENRIVAELEGTYHARGHKCLSPDGLSFAASNKSPNQEDTEVLVWDTKTGKQKFKVLGDPNKYADVVVLSNDSLYVGGRSESLLDSFNITTGAHQRTLNFDGARLREDNVSITLDGKYIVLDVKRRLTVFRLADGKAVAGMADPDNEATFTLAWMQSLAFAPDAQELAMVSSHPSPRLICWNTQGKVVRSSPLAGDLRRAGSEERLQWFPDRNAWLIGNFVHERESGMHVIVIKEKFAQDLQIAVHDVDHLIGTFPHNPKQVELYPVPWKEIRASVAALKAKEGALLTPGTTIGLRTELAKIGGDSRETADWIYNSMTARLAKDGLQVKQAEKTYLRLRYTEAAISEPAVGELPPVEVMGSLTIDLMQDGSPQSLWNKTIPGPTLKELARSNVGDDVVRSMIVSRIRIGITEIEIPQFVPNSKDLPSLPIVLR